MRIKNSNLEYNFNSRSGDVIFLFMKQTKIIEKFIEENIDELDWAHTKEVRAIAKKLADLEKANKEIVDIAALLHDVSKSETVLLEHAAESAKMAEKFLEKLEYDEEFIKRVVECIITHSSPWAKNAPMPKSIEAKVLFDADMLQQLSPFGIVKHILKYKNEPFNKIVKNSKDDLVKFAFELLLTKSGKRIGKEKVKYVKEFFKLIKNNEKI